MSRWSTVPIAATVALLVVAAVTSACGSGTSGTATPALAPAAPSLPVASGVTSPSTSAVLLPMGHLDDPTNTFWELFLRPSGSPAWTLHTPPGVADNGGLVAAVPTTGALAVGFLPSQDLRFSPVSLTTDGGGTWSPGQLPVALEAAPDALSVGPDGRLAAVAATAGQTLLTSTGDPTTWLSTVSRAAVAREVPTCGVGRLSAVAFDPAGGLALGLQCTRRGVIGLAVASPPTATGPVAGRRWTVTSATVPTGVGDAISTVLRLESTDAGLQALAELRSGSSSWLGALWAPTAAGRWTRSAALPVPSGWSVQATATGGANGRGVAVLLSSGADRRIEEIEGPGSAWTAVPSVPVSAATLAWLGGETDVFVGSNSHLSIWTSTVTAAGWSRTASITVPIQYGSSS